MPRPLRAMSGVDPRSRQPGVAVATSLATSRASDASVSSRNRMMRTIWRDSDGYDTRVTRLPAWFGITGWWFESSSAHRKPESRACRAFQLSTSYGRDLSPPPARGNTLGNIRRAAAYGTAAGAGSSVEGLSMRMPLLSLRSRSIALAYRRAPFRASQAPRERRPGSRAAGGAPFPHRAMTLGCARRRRCPSYRLGAGIRRATGRTNAVRRRSRSSGPCRWLRSMARPRGVPSRTALSGR